MPWASTTDTTVDPTAFVDQAIYQLQSALALPDGAISRSSQPPILSGSDVALRWLGGKADVDLGSGHIRAVLVENTANGSGTLLSKTDLDDEADRLVELLGWDSATLETQGFTPGEAKVVDRGDAGIVYQKAWVGHDAEGVLNQGMIEVGVDATSGDLHSFLYSPGPQTALDMTKTITRDEAVKTAASGSARVESATLVHTNKAGITGGRDMLVWIVKLAADTASSKAGATVYLDAVSGRVLVIIAT